MRESQTAHFAMKTWGRRTRRLFCVFLLSSSSAAAVPAQRILSRVLLLLLLLLDEFISIGTGNQSPRHHSEQKVFLPLPPAAGTFFFHTLSSAP